MTILRTVTRKWRDQSGGVLVEFAVVIALFLFLFFTLLDFGRLAYTRLLAEKASQLAVRMAVVRPPACAGVPETHERGVVPNGTEVPVFGTSCSSGGHVCAAIASVSCTGIGTDPTAQEIWTRIDDLLPPDATITAVEFEYDFDPNLGFLGGPYTPMVTVEINLPAFQFISPLGALASAAGAANPGSIGADITYPSFSVSLPAEDLATGTAG